MKYTDKLSQRVIKVSNHIIVGLDPDIEKIPHIFLKYKNPVYEFLNRIILLTRDKVCGYKFNLAFFEYYGIDGLEALNMLLKEVPEGLLTIADAKRGDIGNSSEMYAKTYFEKMNFDAVTASPYMGVESIAPFLKYEDKFVYLLALTSNAGAEQLQMLKTESGYLYETVIKLFREKFPENTGYVFGANHLKEIKHITKKYPDLALLIPGIGAQGGSKQDIENNINNNLYLMNSSRGILYSADKNCTDSEFDEKVIDAVNRI
ncbi:MAG TPA: orotidine-5'-phosphate decarboxylase [Ignavibacteria bacterium]|nr:orotidine-5'-phosphate decarboxylase [Ignavibacteria bacterium]